MPRVAMTTRASSFRGRTVLVTGASLGVGRATAHAFHRAGASVVLVARQREALEQAAVGLERALVAPADVSDLAAMERVLHDTVERFGGLDGLVNNAGLHHRGAVAKRSPEEIAAMVDVNLRAPLVLSRMALPLLARRGGFIVNVASLAGKVPLDGAATYSATKFGLRAFTYALAEELRGSGVTVSAVSPGPISTGFILDKLEEVEDVVFSQDLCSAEDVAAMILACARDGAVERQFPALGGRMATLGYLVPRLRRWMKPLLDRKGARVKARLRRERAERP
jgi:short-subunit dehydrogenase